jgi:hypothetical protein
VRLRVIIKDPLVPRTGKRLVGRRNTNVGSQVRFLLPSSVCQKIDAIPMSSLSMVAITLNVAV